jgi:hypothetical protein
MSSFPDSVYAPRAKENRSGVVYDPDKKSVGFVEDITKLDDEVVALENSIGIEPHSRARGYRNTSVQSINNEEVTKVGLNAESYDELGEFDPVTNFRFTATNAGYYIVSAKVRWSSTVATKSFWIQIRKNGSDISNAIMVAPSTTPETVGCSDIVYLAAGQYLELYVYQDSGGARNIEFGSGETFLAVHKLSP